MGDRPFNNDYYCTLSVPLLNCFINAQEGDLYPVAGSSVNLDSVKVAFHSAMPLLRPDPPPP